MAKKERLVFGVFLVAWTSLLITNKWVGDCWFYNDEAGEYAFSEMITLLFYFVSMVMLARFAVQFKNKRKIFIVPVLFILWLFLEECNYGQVFLGKSPTNYYNDEEQSSLHTAMLRPVYVDRTTDLAEVASFIVLILITAGIPLTLKYYFKFDVTGYVLWFPLALAFFCYLGFLVPWDCGYDSFEEIVETLMSSVTVYYSFLVGLHLKRENNASIGY